MLVSLAPDEWMLLAPPGPAEIEVLHELASDLAARHQPPDVPGPVLVARLPDEDIDPRLGPVALHVIRGHVVIYCPAGQTTAGAAARLSAALAVAAGQRDGRLETIAITRVPHSVLIRREVFHPAGGLMTEDAEYHIVICKNLIKAAAAEAIGRLCTAWATCLLV
jgi:hypothetical protein